MIDELFRVSWYKFWKMKTVENKIWTKSFYFFFIISSFILLFQFDK